jgi:DNA-binding transcriptional LysR family regulator
MTLLRDKPDGFRQARINAQAAWVYLTKREADVAIRFGVGPPKIDIVVRRVLIPNVGLFASHAYLKKHGRPKRMEDLSNLQLVSYREPLIESHVRNPDGSWTTTFAGPGETLTPHSIDARLDVDAIYSGMTLMDGRMQLP